MAAFRGNFDADGANATAKIYPRIITGQVWAIDRLPIPVLFESFHYANDLPNVVST